MNMIPSYCLKKERKNKCHKAHKQVYVLSNCFYDRVLTRNKIPGPAEENPDSAAQILRSLRPRNLFNHLRLRRLRWTLALCLSNSIFERVSDSSGPGRSNFLCNKSHAISRGSPSTNPDPAPLALPLFQFPLLAPRHLAEHADINQSCLMPR